MPLFIIIIASVLSLIPNKLIKNIFFAIIILFSLYNIFLTQKYYSTTSKTQFDQLINEVVVRNEQKDVVVSEYGWLLGSYIDKTKIKKIETSTFEDYISSMKNKAVKTESFWYFNGNSHPFNIKEENQLFLDQNFTLDQDINTYFDTWAKHYSFKGEQEKMNSDDETLSNEINLYLNEFKPYVNGDGKGNLYMFENGTIKSKEIELKEGQYELTIRGNSLPEKPIQNKNAHLIISINNKKITDYFLSEKPSKKDKKITFDIPQKQKCNIEVSFDNDLSIDGLDRNVILFSLKVMRIKK